MHLLADAEATVCPAPPKGGKPQSDWAQLPQDVLRLIFSQQQVLHWEASLPY
jgi:hypothetical protein